MTDRDAAKEILFRLGLMHPQITSVRADSGSAGQLVNWANTHLDLALKTVSRPSPTTSTRLRTAHPALGITEHLGRDHVHARHVIGRTSRRNGQATCSEAHRD
ncbi:hypothetical protein [Streptomyces sp. NPDC048282]|uniref:hypothetical protein n=1 Tax=Streptomyces sp. NPDC048282 TaxID=3365528 RepID=UPI003719A65B